MPADLHEIKRVLRARSRGRIVPGATPGCPYRPNGEFAMSKSKWIKPAYTDLRLGFEITMYISNR